MCLWYPIARASSFVLIILRLPVAVLIAAGSLLISGTSQRLAPSGTEKIDLSLPGAGKSGQFDRVYKNSDGTWSIVECKGGASPLKGRSGAQQGTKPYIQSIRQFNYIKNNNSLIYINQEILKLCKAAAIKKSLFLNVFL
jgi:hypothetical protein